MDGRGEEDAGSQDPEQSPLDIEAPHRGPNDHGKQEEARHDSR